MAILKSQNFLAINNDPDRDVVKVEIIEFNKISDNHTQRKIKLTDKHTEESLIVTYEIMSGWERDNKPSRKNDWMNNFLHMSNQIRNAQTQHPNTPILVQSESGGGRPSVLMALHYIQRYITEQRASGLEEKDIKVNIFKIVESLIQQRVLSIYRFDQYQLLYEITAGFFTASIKKELIHKPGGYNF